MSDTQKIFLVPVLKNWLLFAPFSQQVALLNHSAASLLKDGSQLDQHPELSNFLETFKTDQVVVKTQPADQIVPSFLGIIPTRGCNIGCVYCNFSGPTAQKTHMSPKIAVNAIDWMAKLLADQGLKRFQIHFFGGEPFISPEIVDIVVHRARYMADQYGLETYFDASTNGVFNDNMRHFIADYFNGIVLSLDGPPEFHNRNRPAVKGKPTFDIVDKTAKFLRDSPIDLCLRICITSDSVQQMEDITAWACEEYQPSVINFESLTPGDLAQSAGLEVPDPYLFAKHCFGSYSVAREYGIEVVYSAATVSQPRHSFCPVGTDALIVSLDGRTSACYLQPEDWQARGMDLDVGWINENGKVDMDFDAVIRAREHTMDKPRCKDCFCQWTCAGGCHVNHTYPGAEPEYSDFCKQTRALTALLLLEQLEEYQVADQLVKNESAMNRLMNHRNDSIPVQTNDQPDSAPARITQVTGSLTANGVNISG